MLIGVEKRFIFVANTKTASTSIEHALMDHAEIHRGGSPARKHIPLVQVYKFYDFLFGQPAHRPASYFAFGVMRDPIEWVISWFRYRKGNKVENGLPQDMTFAQFWERNDWNITRPDGRRHLQRQMFCDWQGRVLADAIIPYHDLDAQFARLCKTLSIPVELQRRNVSVLRHLGEELPRGLEREMRDFYARDYEIFDSLDTINARGAEKLARMIATGATA